MPPDLPTSHFPRTLAAAYRHGIRLSFGHLSLTDCLSRGLPVYAPYIYMEHAIQSNITKTRTFPSSPSTRYPTHCNPLPSHSTCSASTPQAEMPLITLNGFAGSDGMGFSRAVLLTVVLSLCAAYIAQKFWQWYRLRHVPGPLWAGISRGWMLRHTLAGNMNLKLKEVCDDYGKSASAAHFRCPKPFQLHTT